jgi:hypothetical protein
MKGERDAGIDASAFHDAAKALERAGFERQAGRTVAWALRRSGNVVRRHVRAELKRHRRTGRLAGNVRTRFSGVGLGFSARIWSGGPIAHLIAGGVQPHAIAVTDDKRAMTIRAPGRAGGVVGFAAAIQHPGFSGDPYFRRGVKAAAPEINAIVAKSAETMASELAYRMRSKS